MGKRRSGPKSAPNQGRKKSSTSQSAGRANPARAKTPAAGSAKGRRGAAAGRSQALAQKHTQMLTAAKAVPGRVEDLELHRDGVALHVPGSADRPATTTMIFEGTPPRAICTCGRIDPEFGACPHILKLDALRSALVERTGSKDLGAHFQGSGWYRLLGELAEDEDIPLHSVVVEDGEEEVRGQTLPVVRVIGPERTVVATYLAQGPAPERLRSRLALRDRSTGTPRALILEWLMERQASSHERQMRAIGHRTRGQVIEESVWHRLAYHGYREHAFEQVTVAVAVDRESGALRVTVSDLDERPLMRVNVPRRAARRFLRGAGPGELRGLRVGAAPLRPQVRMLNRADGGLRVEPVVRVAARPGQTGAEVIPAGPAPGGDGEAETGLTLVIEERFRYADMAYLPALDAVVPLSEPGPVAEALRLDHPRDLDPEGAHGLLAKVATALSGTPSAAPDELLGLRVLTSFQQVEIDPRALQRDWCWLSLRYGAGDVHISLDDIMAARARGQRFIETDAGWVDTEAPAFEPLAELLARHQIETLDALTDAARTPGSGLRMTRLALLRLLAAGGEGLAVATRGDQAQAQAQAIDRLLEVVPAQPLAPLRGLVSTLRDYQVRGVEWLLYLYDNGFGGLLCDDMGLGKTHQIMAFLVALREQRQVAGPFLVICPTTVLSHWKRLIDAYAPALQASIFHGAGRDLRAAMLGADVVLTSYGILRNDIDALSEVGFAAAVFDEAQLLKNPATQAYQAAVRLGCDLRLGMSGTPIENSLADLEALFDLVLPGYLGSRERFRVRYIEPIEQAGDAGARRELQRVIAPFTLRRTKQAVLDQLPPKIEDVRTCELSEEQVKLYRDAVDTRGRELMQALRNLDQPVPYVHIFALLTLLKQICCHPALVTGTPERYQDHHSGKWELARELVRECLDSGQKIVIYSQFLGMLGIFERYLTGEGVGYAKLTGRTRKRGEVIARFQEDPDCRVFLASLTAGGVGIDLVAASVVLHYDRWWNAAREDQATDRVHRIGQNRGVHVLKLVTEGTLEEKIAAIIAKKRQLMESVVTEDDKGSLKTLSREELASLMDFAPIADR
ncbi:DEAD/DEAH box helicase [Haliangium sp.]|uniref:DEAD/DEAH box helicase n=1 Tax=Haliangium sp. TaxID=2663208 RepID=UPI003D0998D9